MNCVPLLYLCLFLFGKVISSPSNSEATVVINTTHVIYEVENYYASFTLDYWYPNISREPASWENCSAIIIDLKNKLLLEYTRAISPAILRVGGTVADTVVYDFPNPPVTFYEKQPYYCPGILCLTKKRFEEIIQFCRDTNLKLVFGLNSLGGRYENATYKWDYRNTFQMLTWIHDQKYIEEGIIYGLELGNEMNHAHVTPAQVLEDFQILAAEVNRLWPDPETRPRILGPDIGGFASDYFNGLLKTGILSATTHHRYDGAGTDKDLLSRITTPSFLNGHIDEARAVRKMINKSPFPDTKAIMGEGAAAYSSGREGVTDRFVSSFYYVDTLGSLAQEGITSQFRQAFVGGFYSLLSRNTSHTPNSDYYIHLLWRRLVGNRILSTSSTPTCRVYTQCSVQYSGGVVIEVVNLNKDPTVINSVSIPLDQKRIEYRISATDLTSEVIMLNGEVLKIGKDGALPELKGKENSGELKIDGLSLAFIVYPNANIAICHTDKMPLSWNILIVPAISLSAAVIFIVSIIAVVITCQRRRYHQTIPPATQPLLQEPIISA